VTPHGRAGASWGGLGLCCLSLAACGVRVTSLHSQDPAPGAGPITTGPGQAGPSSDAGGDPADSPSDGGMAVEPEAGALAAEPDAGLPASVPGLKIAGVFVPREKAIVLLHIGHSNMAGRAVNPETLKPYFYEPDPRLWSYHPRDPITATGPIELRPAVEPLAEDVSTMGLAGPGMALLRAALARTPDGYVISIGSGQSGAAYGLCESFKRGGLFYDYYMKAALLLKGYVTFGGLFTMFGANEYWDRDPSGLAECLRQLASDVRNDLDAPDMPFMVGDFEMTAGGQYLPTLPGPAAVIVQLHKVPSLVTRSALIPTEGLPLEDDHHFNLTAHKIWGERAIEIMVEKGWTPWAAR
jgi:hypothetical protein